MHKVGDERQPLLPSSSIHSTQSTSPDSPQNRRWPTLSIAPIRAFLSSEAAVTIICVFILQFLISFAKHVVEVPIVRLFENAICDRYYSSHRHEAFDPINGRSCKITPIQNQLAFITGFRFGFDAFGGVISAIYYGGLADRLGRRLVLILFCIGTLLSLVWIVLVCYLNRVLPTQLVWISSIFLLVGGGQRVAKSMLFTIIADSVDQSSRSRYMYLLSSVPHVCTLIAPPAAAFFMQVSIWLSFEIACGTLVVGSVLVWLMPESLKYQQTTKDHPGSHVEALPSLDEDEEPLLPEEQPRENISSPTLVPSRQLSWWEEIKELFEIPGLRFCFALFFIVPVGLISKAFVYQHASERFHWTYTLTTWLRVSQATGASLVTFITLPFLTTILIHRGYRAQVVDLNVIRVSLLIAAIGFGLLWQARAGWMLLFALFIAGLSEGLEPALQGLATALDMGRHARMFTTVAVIETVGKLIGGPGMARLFAIGRSGGHGSMGICFLAASMIFVLLLVAACIMRVKR